MKFPEIFLEVSRNSTDILRIILKNFKKFPKISIIMAENLKIITNILKNISENSMN